MQAHAGQKSLEVSFAVVCGQLTKRHLALELAAEGAFAVITNLMRSYPLDVAVQQVRSWPTCLEVPSPTRFRGQRPVPSFKPA